MKKYIYIPIVSFILFSLLIASCRNSRNNSATAITEYNWKLIELNGERISTTGAREPFIVFQPKDNKVNGNAGCNNFFGNYQINGEQITISNVGATKMACQNMQLETSFFQLLQTPLTFSISENDLIFKNNDGNVAAKFEKITLR
jgi:heat shock protein HslJ